MTSPLKYVLSAGVALSAFAMIGVPFASAHGTASTGWHNGNGNGNGNGNSDSGGNGGFSTTANGQIEYTNGLATWVPSGNQSNQGGSGTTHSGSGWNHGTGSNTNGNGCSDNNDNGNENGNGGSSYSTSGHIEYANGLATWVSE